MSHGVQVTFQGSTSISTYARLPALSTPEHPSWETTASNCAPLTDPQLQEDVAIEPHPSIGL